MMISKKRRISKHVRFSRVLNVTTFKRVSAAEAKHVWYESADRHAMKSEGREMASSYRKFGDLRQGNTDYRGFENYSEHEHLLCCPRLHQ